MHKAQPYGSARRRRPGAPRRWQRTGTRNRRRLRSCRRPERTRRCANAATAEKATAKGEKCTLTHPPLSEISWGALDYSVRWVHSKNLGDHTRRKAGGLYIKRSIGPI